MANEVENALKSAATSAAAYVRDVSTLNVETRYVTVGGENAVELNAGLPAARTVIKLDGDCESVIPMRMNAAGALEIDTGLYEVHLQNVNTAIEYRARILNALLGNLIGRTV